MGSCRGFAPSTTPAAEVESVRFEWAPPREHHFGGGSAFDAFVSYRTSDGASRFVGVEVKYAEDLAKSSISVRPDYIDFTAECGHWHKGATSVLDTPRLKQFWLNTLLAQSLVAHGGEGFESGKVAIVALGADASASATTTAVHAKLVDHDRWLCWSPYEAVLDVARGPEGWKEAFIRRYVDFGPVAHLLAADDPRRSLL